MLPLLLAATLATAPVPAPPAAAGPQIYARADAGAPLTGLAVVVSAGTAREGAGQNGLAALTAETLLMGRIDGVSLNDRVEAAGGAIDFVVTPSVVRFDIELLPSAVPAVAAALAHAFAAPDTSAATVAAARAALGSRIEDDARNPIAVGLEMLRGSYYAGTAGAPSLGTRASLVNLGPDDVAGFFAAHYRRATAFAGAVGSFDGAANDAVAAALAALPAGSEPDATLVTNPFGDQPKHVVAQRDIGVPFALVGFAAPAMTDADFAPMLVLRALLDDVASRPSSTTLEPFERGINVIYDYDVKPATFTVAINGSRIDPSAGLTVLEAVVKTATVKLNADVISRYKATALGDWALEAQTLTDRAWQIGAAVNEGGTPDLAHGVATAIGAVTPADVQRCVSTYLQRYTVALVLPRTRQ
jgi:predicted Zn-dependent peptidase